MSNISKNLFSTGGALMLKKEIPIHHDLRRMIYNHIEAHPGVSFNTLKKVFGLKDGTLRYHLDYLKKSEKIIFGVEKGKRFYYPYRSGTLVLSIKDDRLQTNKLNFLQEQILDVIRENPGINQKELVKVIGLSRFKVKNNLNKLLDLCIIRRIPNKRNVCYEYISNDQLKFEMLMSLVTKLLKKEIDEVTFLKLKRKLE